MNYYYIYLFREFHESDEIALSCQRSAKEIKSNTNVSGLHAPPGGDCLF